MPPKTGQRYSDWIYNRDLIDSLPSPFALYATLRRLAVIIPAKRFHAPTTFALLSRLESRLTSYYRQRPSRRFQKVIAAWGPHWIDMGDERVGMVLRELYGVDPTLELFPRLLAGCDVFLDIGSNHGTFAMSASASMCPDAEIIAFEPQSSLATLIERTFRENRLSRAKVLNVALSDNSGRSILAEDCANSGIAQLEPNSTECIGGATNFVDCARLDEVIEKLNIHGQRWAIKIDVEGHELKVFQGGQAVLRDRHPLIICEINCDALNRFSSTPDDLLSFLRGFGYDTFIDVDIFPEPLSVQKVSSARHAYNFIALSSVHQVRQLETIRSMPKAGRGESSWLH